MRKSKEAFCILIISFFGLFSCEKAENVIEKKGINFPAAYIVNSDNTISVIDLNSLEVDTTFLISTKGDSFAHHIYKSPDETKLAVALPSIDFSNGHDQIHNSITTGGIAILDSKNGNLINRVTTSSANHNALFSPNGLEVWTALMSHDEPKVLIYNSKDLSLNNDVNVGTDASEVVFSSNGNTGFVAAQESSFVYAIDTEKKEVVKEIKVDFFPTNVWAGQKYIFVENKNRQSVNIIDTETLSAIGAIDLKYKPGFVAYQPQNEILWICDGENNQVRLYSKVDEMWNEVRAIKTGSDAHAIAISKTNLFAFVVNQRGNSVSVIDLNSMNKVKDIIVGIKPNGIVLIE